MGTRGWEQVTAADVTRLQQARHAPPAPRAKYRNRKTVIGDQRFDSQREAEDWLALKMREERGEISGLQRQVVFVLYTPRMDESGSEMIGGAIEVARYIADMIYRENGQLVVQDSKGIRTKEYLLKRKWLELQQGIVIRET